ncbi:Secreted RxLR effector protein 78, partial [Lamellibrachia satsuma]
TTDVLYSVLNEIWDKEETPIEWKTGMLVTIPKKGNLSECKNWRGIMLLSVPSKILCRIILDRVQETGQSSLYINFVDFEKAFDSIDRTVLWKLLRHYGLPTKFVTLIKNMYEGFTGHVIFNGQVSEDFQIGTGVRQGCLLSPLLFLIAIDWTMKRSTEHRTGIQWNLFSQLEDLDFADDLALLSETHKHMQQKTE